MNILAQKEADKKASKNGCTIKEHSSDREDFTEWPQIQDKLPQPTKPQIQEWREWYDNFWDKLKNNRPTLTTISLSNLRPINENIDKEKELIGKLKAYKQKMPHLNHKSYYNNCDTFIYLKCRGLWDEFYLDNLFYEKNEQKRTETMLRYFLKLPRLYFEIIHPIDEWRIKHLEPIYTMSGAAYID